MENELVESECEEENKTTALPGFFADMFQIRPRLEMPLEMLFGHYI